MEMITHIIIETWLVTARMAAWLLLGFGVAGLLSVIIAPAWLERHLGGRGLGPVFTASLFGVPLPLCSCGVIPVAASLRQHGFEVDSRNDIAWVRVNEEHLVAEAVLARDRVAGADQHLDHLDVMEVADVRQQNFNHLCHVSLSVSLSARCVSPVVQTVAGFGLSGSMR